MTVYRLVHAGDLPAVRVGRSFRVHEKASLNTSTLLLRRRISLPLLLRRPSLTQSGGAPQVFLADWYSTGMMIIRADGPDAQPAQSRVHLEVSRQVTTYSLTI